MLFSCKIVNVHMDMTRADGGMHGYAGILTVSGDFLTGLQDSYPGMILYLPGKACILTWYAFRIDRIDFPLTRQETQDMGKES